MPGKDPRELVSVVGRDRLERDQLTVAARREGAFGIVDIRDAAAHARRKISPRRPEHRHTATGHVFAAVIADAFDDRAGAAVAYAESLAGICAFARPG